MTFDFKCPNCATLVQAEDEWIGMEASCPNCNNTISVTKPLGQSPAANITKYISDQHTEKLTLLEGDCRKYKRLRIALPDLYACGCSATFIFKPIRRT